MGPRSFSPEKHHAAFWAKVPERVDGQCWEWQGWRHPAGHGQVRRNWKLVYAHRVSYEETHGPVPEGLKVLHNCDNPPCVNPDHLRVGTQADNMNDMKVRGRAGRTRARRAADAEANQS